MTSSQVWIFLTPSPTSLNMSRDSSISDCTRSRARGRSRLVPRWATSVLRRWLLPLRRKSLFIRSCDSRANSGSSENPPAVPRRCPASSDDSWSNDMVGAVNQSR